MRRAPHTRLLLTIALALCAGALRSEEGAELERVLDGYAAARGGVEQWAELGTLRLSGTYAAFSDYEPFTLVWRSDHFYRLDFSLLGGPAVRRPATRPAPGGGIPCCRPRPHASRRDRTRR